MGTIEIKKYGRLDTFPVSEIRELERISNEQDKIAMDIYLGNDINVSDDLKSLFVLFIDDQPISVLSMFVPSTSGGEVYGFTHPEHRKKGYFSQLLEVAKKELKKFNVEKILLLVDSTSESGLEYIEHRNGGHIFSEVLFRYFKFDEDPKDKEDSNKKLGLLDINDYEVSEITKEETKEMAELSQQIFGRDYTTSLVFANKAFEAENKTQYLLHIQKEAIAMATTTIDDGDAYISGVGVKKEYQRMGVGKVLMKRIIEILEEKKVNKIELEADTSNFKALLFYFELGFRAQYQTHYFRIDF